MAGGQKKSAFDVLTAASKRGQKPAAERSVEPKRQRTSNPAVRAAPSMIRTRECSLFAGNLYIPFDTAGLRLRDLPRLWASAAHVAASKPRRRVPADPRSQGEPGRRQAARK